MSGWTILSVRGRNGYDYEHAMFNEHDRWDATADIVATMDADDSVCEWTTWSSHVYAYLRTSRYNWEFAESVLSEYAAMIDDAVVLGANDTTDTGTARYYPRPDNSHTDEYAEDQENDGYHVGEIALATMTARHGIVARDPFHNQCGRIDDVYLEHGSERT